MGLYIPGMKMPPRGKVKMLVLFDDGVLLDNEDGQNQWMAIELPPHGRLGDLDELVFYFNESAEGLHGTPKWAEIFRECAKAVREAETIIPADPEGGDANAD